MPSSPSPGASSPAGGAAARRSRFTYRQLSQMAAFSASNPLRVVAHIDLDAFYAQCEMIRLGIPEDKPLAVQQWQGLIAVNYPAREFGISRLINVTEARKLCPDLIAPHVATWREGDDKWAYRPDSAANIASDKVSLDPYRLESRKILATVKEALPQDTQRVEKASIDEVFLDLSAQVHSVLLARFPELSGPPPYGDPTERLPLPSIAALDWQADALVDLDEEEESLDPDWDDVAILLGSEIVRDVRAQIREKLGYTCSAGIANNKLVSKLGSAYKKPNAQTVVRGRAVLAFMAGFKVSKLRNLGGKLGDQVVSTFEVETVKDLLDVSLGQMKAKLGEETGMWMYNTARGIDTSDVSARTQIKSMLSAKSFRPTISSAEQAVRWLRIFVGDIYSRLVEEGVLENKRRPRTITLHHRHGGQTKSRQGPIPQGKVLDEELLLGLAKDLHGHIIAEGHVWPCINLSLAVGGFEEGIKGNMGIDSFLVKGEEAEALRDSGSDSRPGSAAPERQVKRRRVDEDAQVGIQRFFAKTPASPEKIAGDQAAFNGSETGLLDPHRSPDLEMRDRPNPLRARMDGPMADAQHPDTGSGAEGGDESIMGEPGAPDFEAARDRQDHDATYQKGRGHSLMDDLRPRRQLSIGPFLCARCQVSLEDADALQSHEDWHMATDLQEEERVNPAFAGPAAASRAGHPKGSSAYPKRGRGARGRGGRQEHGQKRLDFG